MAFLDRKAETTPFHERRQSRHAEQSGVLQDATSTAPLPQRGLRSGATMLIFLALGLLTVAGINEVRTRAEILERGAQLSQLSAEHAQLEDEKRRLEAERAFLRHPDHVAQVATERFQMLPAPPERVRQIHLHPAKTTAPNRTMHFLQQLGLRYDN